MLAGVQRLEELSFFHDSEQFAVQDVALKFLNIGLGVLWARLHTFVFFQDVIQMYVME